MRNYGTTDYETPLGKAEKLKRSCGVERLNPALPPDAITADWKR